MVVGAIVEHEDKVLLCRRGIDPQRGLWTVPAGFLENYESSAEGAVREIQEETGAEHVEIIAPFVHFDIVGIAQAYILFRARLAFPFKFAASVEPETLETRLFGIDEIPFDELAFSSVDIALRKWIKDREQGRFGFYHATIVKLPGAGANEKGTFELKDLYTV